MKHSRVEKIILLTFMTVMFALPTDGAEVAGPPLSWGRLHEHAGVDEHAVERL